jgi:membrane dipeptidase
MRILDLHADIGMDVLAKHKEGETDVLRRHHIDKLNQGGIGLVGMACFFEGTETMEDLKAMVKTLRKEIKANPESIHFYLGGIPHADKINAMMTLEGMCPIQTKIPATLRWLYDQGVRVASFSWNDENALSTGVKGDPSRGLTKLGIQALRTMNELGMIVDVSHASEKSFWDILTHSKAPIIATHSNARTLCNAERNLSDQQIKAIARQKGLIGLVAARHFVSFETAKQDADTLAKHARHIADIAGVDVLAIGFDFMDYLGGPFSKASMASDLQDASQAQNLVKALLANGFTEEETHKIAWENAVGFLIRNLKP